MNNIKENPFVAEDTISLEQAMGVITDNHRGVVAVIDSEGYLQGVLSDGDIRRGMLKGAMTHTPISKIVNTNPKTILSGPNTESEAREMFQKNPGINIIPIVDEKNKLIDVKVVG